jgi:YVTN family beta-propeller protein
MKGGGYWMTFSPDGSRCYVSERIGNSVAVIDADSRETIARVAVGNSPKRVVLVTIPVGSASTRR